MNTWIKYKEQRVLYATFLWFVFKEVASCVPPKDSVRVVRRFARRLIRSARPSSLGQPPLNLPAPKSVYGFRSTIREWLVRDALYVVLNRIRDRFPDDWAHLRQHVKVFAPLPRSIKRKRGQWHADSGAVLLSALCHEPIALVAHELGHVCTRPNDLTKRQIAGFNLARELSADAYAIKWGFGRHIARSRSSRDTGHHGPAPGAVLTISGKGQRARRYTLTRGLYLRPLKLHA